MSTEQHSRSVIVERNFPHAPEKLWRALTDSQLVAQWLMNNDLEPVVGRKFQFRSNPVPNWDGLIECEILIVNPLRQLSFRWRSLGLDSVVLFTLTPADGGTHLRMEQSGFRPDQPAAYRGATYGWEKFLNNMERLLEGDLT